jgi:PAS domain S-box-containing protein
VAPQHPFNDLEQARSHLAAIIESSNDAIISKTLDGIVLTWNAGAERLYGYAAEEAVDQPMTFLLPEKRIDEELEILDRIKRGERVEYFETVRLRKDGQQIDVSLTISPIRDRNGHIVAVSHIARDITERKHAEDAVRESEAKIRAFLESASQGVIAVDATGRIDLTNAKVEDLFGYGREELLGQTLEMLLPDRFRRVHIGHRTEYFANPRPRPMGLGLDLAGRRKDGTEFPIEIALSQVPSRKGPLAIAFINDISERRRTEEAMRRTQRLESLGILAGGVAHDFNNLLTTIMGNGTLAMQALQPTHPDYPLIEEIVRASKTAADLTRQLLAYAGHGRFMVEVVDLSQLVRDISALVQTSIPKKVQLRLRLADNLPPVRVDVSQIQQLVMNLVINAGEAMGEHVGTILATTERQAVDDHYIRAYFAPGELEPGEYVSLEVNDTGSGMDEATKARIFDPFFTTKKTGRGLGLSAVQGIVRGHKGAMRVYSAPGKGTTFKVLLPATSLSLSTSKSTEELPEPKGHGRILIIDDEASVRTLLAAIIERQGYSVITAADGAQAIDIFEQEGDQIDLVILDLTMPVMSGEETFRELHLIRPNIPVLLSSGFNESEAVQRFSGKGLAGFVQKPYTARQITQGIKRALGRTD